MIRLPRSLAALGTPAFGEVLRHEIEQLDPALLPLQEALTVSSHVAARPFQVMVRSVSETPDHLAVKAGIFYTGVIAGCSCADDPTPLDEQNEYCVVLFTIDRATAAATVTLLAD